MRLGGRDVLAGISLKIASGEFVGVLGPNGAGKTTLMRAVLGLVPAASGAIRVLGRSAARGNPAVGYMPQVRSAGGHLRLTGWNFVAGIVDGHRMGLPFPGKAARSEVDRVLDLVGAVELARRPLIELSGGERQRLLLAQALIGSRNCCFLTAAGQSRSALPGRRRRARRRGSMPIRSHDPIQRPRAEPAARRRRPCALSRAGQAALGTVEEVIPARCCRASTVQRWKSSA